jgi:endonuclease/exonuclease/phosphatase family metal-dependent hydrolase
LNIFTTNSFTGEFTVRVLTYNIHGWRDAFGEIDVARLARIIAASQADIVALNEVFHPLVPPGETRPALDLLAAALGMEAVFGVALTPQFAFAPLASYGNALLTRYPVLAHAGHHLTPIEGHEQRGLLEARVRLPDGKTPFSVYVTHLDHLSEDVRAQQLAAALQWTMRDRERPHLILGDFNALAPADYAADPAALDALKAGADFGRLAAQGMDVIPRLLRRGYSDAQAANPDPTFPADRPLVRIDYIWLSAPLAPALRWCRPWTTAETAVASDHLPVLAEIDL